MAEHSSALYDFAIATWADADLDRLPRAVSELSARYFSPPPVVELFGRPDTGEILVLFRFAFAHYSAALRQKMETEAGRLGGRLIEIELLAAEERQRFYTERLGAFTAWVDASGEVGPALGAFRRKMGLLGGAPLALSFDSEDGLTAAWRRAVLDGRLFVPCSRPPHPGTLVKLLLQTGKLSFEADGTVLEAAAEGERKGFLASVTPGSDLSRFLARQAARERAGRCREARPQRRHARYDVCLEVSFQAAAELREEFATNIGKGGLFVRTEHPPALRSAVRLRLTLPDGQTAETDAEVVHVIGPEEARARGCAPGAGLSFAIGDTLFLRVIETFLAEVPVRKPRILVADDDRFLREVLKDALEQAGCEVDLAANGEEALHKLADRLFELDALVLDLVMPGLDGYCLIDRIRRVGGELDLKIAVLSGAAGIEQLEELRQPGTANEVIAKGTTLEEIVARIKRLLE